MNAKTLAFLLSLLTPFFAQAEIAVIRVEAEPKQVMTYGMDFERLWHFTDKGKSVDLDELARYAVGECRVDYVRVAISAAAELKEGVINWSVYDRQLLIMRALQRIRPDLKFFASPRPIHNDIRGAPFTPFPLWVSIWQNPLREDETTARKFLRFDSEKAAGYYVRYLRFMREQGFPMAYLDATNEATLHLDPAELGDMIDRVRAALGDDMPLVIAPSAHNRKEAIRWIREAERIKRTDFWDITATHNTGAKASLEDFVAAAGPLGKPIWNTELHGFVGPDADAAKNSQVLWAHIRAGFGGINDWLSLGNEKKEHKMFRNVGGRLERMRTFYIFKHLVNTSGGGRYHASNVPESLASTAAFSHEESGIFTVWALNTSDVPVEAVIHIDGFFGHPTEVRWWGPKNRREGETLTEGLEGESSIQHKLLGDTLYCFTFERHN